MEDMLHIKDIQTLHHYQPKNSLIKGVYSIALKKPRNGSYYCQIKWTDLVDAPAEY